MCCPIPGVWSALRNQHEVMELVLSEGQNLESILFQLRPFRFTVLWFKIVKIIPGYFIVNMNYRFLLKCKYFLKCNVVEITPMTDDLEEGPELQKRGPDKEIGKKESVASKDRWQSACPSWLSR